MNTLELFLLALALAVDAFTVGASIALSHRHPRQVFRLSFHFGLFQALFALCGLLLGAVLFSFISVLDHWLAFGLLLFIGLRMLRNGNETRKRGEQADLTRGFSLMILSAAVSIDAFAAGVGLAAMSQRPQVAVLMIGLVSGLATWMAFRITGPLHEWLGKRGEKAAGLVLIALGLKILIEHLLAG